MTRARKVTVEDVGPVTRFEFTLKPGITVLEGAMGAGKSRTAAATARLFGNTDVPVEPRDGADHGTVSTDGVTLTIRKVVRATGETDISIGDVGALAALIDPQIKDSDAAAVARLRALAKLVKPPVTDDAIATLAGGDDALTKYATEAVKETGVQDLLRAAEKVRLTAHSMKRNVEKAADEAAGQASTFDAQAKTALAALGGQTPGEVPVAEALEAERAAVEAHARARLLCDQRTELERQQAEVRATLGQKPDPSACEKEIIDADAWLVVRRKAATDLDEELRLLTERVSDARNAVRQAEGRVKAANEAKDAESQKLVAYERQARILERTIMGPDADEVERLAAKARVAGAATALARLSEAYLTNHDRAAAAHQKAAEMAKRAAELELLATSVGDRLGELLAGTAAEGLTVSNGRLCAVEGGKPLDFERRLSFGQRARAAFRVFAKVSPDAVAPFDPAVWSGFDDATKDEVARIAAEEGIYALTEASTHGPLSARHVPEDE